MKLNRRGFLKGLAAAPVAAVVPVAVMAKLPEPEPEIERESGEPITLYVSACSELISFQSASFDTE